MCYNVTTLTREVIFLKSVGIRELKRSISTYLRQVQSGERILITDRKKPLAIISAVENNQENEIIKQLAETGVAHWTGGKPSGAVPRLQSKKSISEAVLEDRR
jgi:prevent-host-death family protein